MLDSKQRFKAAFIARCIEEGHATPEAVLERVKMAREKIAFVDKALGGAALLGAAAVGVPTLGGFMAGSAAGKLRGINDINLDEIKRQELIDELRRQTDRLQQHNQARQSQSKQDKRRPGRAFM